MRDLNVHISGLYDIDADSLFEFFHAFLCMYNSDLYVFASIMTSDEFDYVDNSDVLFGNKKVGEIFD